MREETGLFTFLNTQPLVQCLVDSRLLERIYRINLKKNDKYFMTTQGIEAWPSKPQFLIEIFLIIIFINHLPGFFHWSNET